MFVDPILPLEILLKLEEKAIYFSFPETAYQSSLEKLIKIFPPTLGIIDECLNGLERDIAQVSSVCKSYMGSKYILNLF